jgi:hypothetical protein
MPEELFKDILFLWILARRSFQGPFVLAELMVVYTGVLTLACQENLSRISLSFLWSAYKKLSRISYLQGSWLHAEILRMHLCAKFDHPMYTARNDIVNSFWQGSFKEKKKEEGEILQLGSQRGGDLQPEKKNMTEGRKYDKTSSIKSEQPAC